MPIDLPAAKLFTHHSARLLDRHRFAALVEEDAAAGDLAISALAAYRNADGGFGHALEPDLRVPESQPSATQYALEILLELGHGADHPFVTGALRWIESIAAGDGGVDFVLPYSSGYPVGPWWRPQPGSFLTTALAGSAHALGVTDEPWLERATQWSIARIRSLAGEGMGLAYWLKYAVAFLDRLPDEQLAAELLESLRPKIEDPSVPVALVPAEVGSEHLTALDLSPAPGSLSRRVLFGDDVIAPHLERVERAQQDDGGWTFDWLQWSPGATVEWRGNVTVRALLLLKAHDRLPRAA